MNSRRPQKHTRKTTVLLILSELFLFSLLAIGLLYSSSARTQKTSSQSIIPQSGSTDDSSSQSFIKWVDFNVTAEAMRQALRLDVDSYNQTPHLNWLELLAFLGARYGRRFFP